MNYHKMSSAEDSVDNVVAWHTLVLNLLVANQVTKSLRLSSIGLVNATVAVLRSVKTESPSFSLLLLGAPQ